MRWLAVVALLVSVACACCERSPQHSSLDQPEGFSEWDRPEWPNDKGPHLLRISENATEAILLFGAYNNGRREENVLVEKVGERVRFRAWWMSWSGGMWCVEVDLKERELRSIWNTLDQQGAFELRDQARKMSHAMTYWLTLRRGEKNHKARAYGIGWYGSTTTFGGETLLSEWPKVVGFLRELRGRYAHHVRPASLNQDGSVNWRADIVTSVLLDEVATTVAEGLGAADLTWEEVLRVGRAGNREIVEAVVSLLDDERSAIGAAACGVLSWRSGQDPEEDPDHWRQWWREASPRYRARAPSSLQEGPHGNGEIRNLGGGVTGFVGVEIDEAGEVWALIDTGGDYFTGHEYSLYRLDRRSDRFAVTGIGRVFSARDGGAPSAAFVRCLGESGVEFPRYRRQAWVSPDGRFGAAILGHDSEYKRDLLVILDFASQRVRPTARTEGRYAAPVVSADGRHVAVAKIWYRADPHGVVVVDTSTGLEQFVPIPSADSLAAGAYVDSSAHGGGFILNRRNPPGPEELWWCSSDGTTARKLLDVPTDLQVWIRGSLHATADGTRVMVLRQGETGADYEHGWLRIADGTFEAIFAGFSTAVDSNSEGSRVVFLHDGQVFEWRRIKESE